MLILGIILGGFYHNVGHPSNLDVQDLVFS
jgi:hypothetical protein